MKILKRMLTLFIAIALWMEISNIQYTASAIENFNRQNMVKAGVLLYSFDDLYMSNLKQSLENFQNTKSNVDFTFLVLCGYRCYRHGSEAPALTIL